MTLPDTMMYYHNKFGDPASNSIKDMLGQCYLLKMWKQNGRRSAIFASSAHRFSVYATVDQKKKIKNNP